jgi:hypothetical protein
MRRQANKEKQHQQLVELLTLQKILILTQLIFLLLESMVTVLEEEYKINQVWLLVPSELYHRLIMINNLAIQKSI